MFVQSDLASHFAYTINEYWRKAVTDVQIGSDIESMHMMKCPFYRDFSHF